MIVERPQLDDRWHLQILLNLLNHAYWPIAQVGSHIRIGNKSDLLLDFIDHL